MSVSEICFLFCLFCYFSYFEEMNKFDIDFITEMFLDTDSVSNTNRIIVAAANAINENNKNLLNFNNILNEEYHNFSQNEESLFNVYNRQQSKYFYENIILDYSDEDYKSKFKMKKSTVQALVTYLKDHADTNSSIIPLEKKVLIFLWLITSNASYTEVGALFGLHKSSVGYIFHEIAAMLEEVRYSFINWPTLEEQQITKLKVYSSYKLPNCVGFIDAWQFKIRSKISKKDTKSKSILLQATCDESLMFIDVYAGEIGQLKKHYVFKDSPLSSELENFVDFDDHILGDMKYKLNINLVTPYTCHEILTSEEMKFNEIHQKTHSYIRRAFQMLKDRFIRINNIDVKIDSVKTVLYAACVLHNFILLHEGNSFVKEETVICDDGVTMDSDIIKNALDKRDFLCNYVNFIDQDPIQE